MNKRRTSYRPRGYMTLEAALVLPLFLFTVLNMYAAINYIAAHVRLCCAMEETGLKLAREAYAYEEIAGGNDFLKGEVADTLLSVTYAKEQVLSLAGRDFLDSCGIAGGGSGISFLRSNITDGNNIELIATYRTEALFVPGYRSFQMGNRAYLKAWTGYDNLQNAKIGGEEEQTVYITETGTVYHLSSDCTHIKLSIREVISSEVGDERNSDGAKYSACELCGGVGEMVYITADGNKYHSSLSCSGLKRTLQAIPISEVGDRPCCLRCQGG